MFRLCSAEHQRYRELVERNDVVDAVGFLGVFCLQQSRACEGDLLRRTWIGEHRCLLRHSVKDRDGAWVLNTCQVIKVRRLAKLHWRWSFFFAVDDCNTVRDLLKQRGAAVGE